MPVQLKEHEDRDGCNKTSKAVDSSSNTALPAAVDNAVRFLGKAALLDEVSAERRPMRMAAVAASAAFGVELPNQPAENPRRLLDPSPERRMKRPKDQLLPSPIAALGEAATSVLEELEELRGLEDVFAVHRRASLEVMSLNDELLQDRKSLQASRAARTSLSALLDAIFGSLGSTESREALRRRIHCLIIPPSPSHLPCKYLSLPCINRGNAKL